MSQPETRTSRRKAASSTADASATQNINTISGNTDKGAVQVSAVFEGLTKFFGASSELLKKLREWVFETITKLGWVTIVFAVLWVPLGVVLGWPEFTFLGGVSTAILLFAIPFLLGKREYKVDFEFLDDHLVAGEPANAPITVTNTNTRLQLPGVLEVHLDESIEEFPIPLLRAGEVRKLPFEIAPQKRGVMKLGPITLVRTDQVGVLRNEIRLQDSRDVWVHPQIRVLPKTTIGFMRDLEGNPTPSIVEADLTFHSIRKYVAGDNPKHIHWKATAKLGTSGEFLIRQYEESRRSRMVIIMALNPGEYLSGDQEFEVAVSAVASLGTRALMDSRSLSIVTSSKVSKVLNELRVQGRKPLMQDLCLINPSELAMPLKEVCRIASKKYMDMSLAVIVVGSTYTSRQLQEIRSVMPNNIGVLFVTTDAKPDSKPKYFKANTVDVLNIQEIQDLPGLLGRYRG